jgi:hypothetical protein
MARARAARAARAVGGEPIRDRSMLFFYCILSRPSLVFISLLFS